MSLRIMGDLSGARAHSEAMLELAELLRDLRLLVLALMHDVQLAMLEGSWVSARAASDRALSLAPRDPRHLSLRAQLEYIEGFFEQGEGYLRRLLDAISREENQGVSYHTYTAVTLAVLAEISNSVDRSPLAERSAEFSITSEFAQPLFAAWARSALALLSVLRGDVTGAREQYSVLNSIHGTVVLAGPAADRILGVLAQNMSNLDQAVAHFEDAEVFCRNAGYRPELARTCCDYADTLLQRNQSGDRDKAMSLLQEALSISQELGMRPLMDRVLERQQRVKAQPDAAPLFPDGLTQREVEVLRLIALGRSDRGIAEDLVLSTRTVNNHVRNILNKTAVANRTEAASYAIRHGLA